MKTVFSNAMLVHVWAQQTQSMGRAHSMRFVDDTLFSYQTPVARILTGANGQRVLLVSDDSYSPTTGGHISGALRAFGYGNPSFRVPSLGRDGGRRSEALDDNGRVILDHYRNLTALLAGYETCRKRMRRKTGDLWRPALDELADEANKVRTYAAAFGLLAPPLDPVADAAEVDAYRAERETRLSTPEAIAKRERERARRKKREEEAAALSRLDSEAKLKAWMEGAPVRLDAWAYAGFAFLRLIGTTVHTSQGAEAPLDDVRKAFHYLRGIRETGHETRFSVSVGHFRVTSISTEGVVTAGCHRFEWSEVERFAKLQGWTS